MIGTSPLNWSILGWRQQVIALIEDPGVIRRILEHLGQWAPLATERSPPPGTTASWPRHANPQSAVALNNLAQTLADLGRLEELEAAARSAVALGGATLPAAESTLTHIVGKRSKARP